MKLAAACIVMALMGCKVEPVAEPESWFTNSNGLTKKTEVEQSRCRELVYTVGKSIPEGHPLENKPHEIYVRCLVRGGVVY